MNRSSHRSLATKLRIFLSSLAFAAAVASLCSAAPMRQARVTQIINDVKILPGQAEAKPAVVNDEVREGTAVRTGVESRSELTFADLSIARLGANTIFSFDQGERSVQLGGGAILLRVPKDSGGAKIKTAAVTAAITGTTVMAEYNCGDPSRNRIQSRCPDARFKFIVLEGSMRVCRTGGAGECVDLGPGQMLAGRIDQPLGEPIEVDIARLLETSLLIQGFPPIGSENLMAAAARDQAAGSSDIGYIALTNTASTDVIDLQDQRSAAQPSPSPSPTASPTPVPTPSPSPTASPSPSPQPTPQKFGTPPIISSSVPYTITSGTTIITDPLITTNGVTDEGRIYRDPATDGPPSAYFFGSTNAFDIETGFNQQFASGQVATFRFQSLRLAGNPTISTANGGPTRLALISFGNIASGAPGGALTFAGIERLLLATADGDITFGSNVSFQDIPALYIYARGSSAVLTIDSAISGTRDLFLYGGAIVRSTGSLVVSQTSTGQPAGLNIGLRARGLINIGGNLDLRTVAGNVQNGGNISVESGGDIVVAGTFSLRNSAAGNTTTGTGGNLDVRSGGSLMAGSLNFSSAFGSSRAVTDGANVRLNVAGNLTTTSGGITFSHATPVGGTPNTLGNGGNLSLIVGGNLNTASGSSILMDLINTSGSTVQNGANIFASIGGNLTAGTVTLRSSNTSNGSTVNGSNLTLDVGGSANIGSFGLTLDNTSGGAIGTGGNILVRSGLDFTAGGTGTIFIDNRSGTISSGPTLDLRMRNFTVNGALTTYIDNRAGMIGSGQGAGRNALVSLALAQALSTSGAARFYIDNSSAGRITGDAIVNLTAASMSVNSLRPEIRNSGNGIINGNATVNLTLSGALTTAGSTYLSITSSGTIGANAAINITAGNISTGELQTHIDMFGGSVGGSATMSLVAANITTSYLHGDIFAPGRMIGSNATVLLSISGALTTTGETSYYIDNSSGMIGGNATITLNAGSISTGAAFNLEIFNSGGRIGGDATINIGAGNISANSLRALIDNSGVGLVTGNTRLTLNTTGRLTTTGNAHFEITTTPSAAEFPAGTSGQLLIRVNADSGFNIGGSFNAFIDDSGGSGPPSGLLGTVLVTSSGTIDVANRLNVRGIINTNSAINAGTIASTDVTSSVSINAGAGGIRQFELPSDGMRTNIMHVLTAPRVTSQGGIDFDGNSASGNVSSATNGGRLTINASSVTFGTDNGDIFGDVTLNGGNSSTALGAGDGGELTVNATNGIVVATDIEATSGFVASNLGPSGRGGAVTLASTQNIVSIDSRIEVSSADPAPAGTPNPPPPRRRSTQGGNITVRSGRVGTPPGPVGGPRTVAVNISNSSQLLALLDAAPTTGPGGKITILATGANTDVNVNGRLAATKGTIDIRHDADGGRVNFGPTSNSDIRTTLSADVIRSRALGSNGQLNVGHTTMSADSLIRLYAPGSNGQLNFVANTTLSSGRAIDLAAGTITIQPNVIVTITGNAGPANIYTNNANYSGFGGNNPNNGTFGGNGANTPQPLTSAPPFEAPLPPLGSGTGH